MARDGQMVGSMVLCDRLREHASSTVKKLQDRGYHTAMLTGAAPPRAFTSNASAQALALDDCPEGVLAIRAHIQGLCKRWIGGACSRVALHHDQEKGRLS